MFFETNVSAKLVGEATETGKLTIVDNGQKELINLNTNQLRDTWKGAIPCLLK